MATATAPNSLLRFGVFELDATRGELRKNGILLKLHPQPAKILHLLASRQNELVTREELRKALWGQDTFVDFEQGLNSCIRQIRSVLADDPDTPRFVQTIPRQGYRFIAPVECLGLEGKTPSTEAPTSSVARHKGLWRIGAIVLAVAVTISLASVFYWKRFDRRSLAATNSSGIGSLAVLPLHNLSRDPEQEYFSDGMTDQLITDLAKFGSLRVISHTSVKRFKGTTRSLPEIARELGVDAVVEGTVTRSGDRVRITAQLIDARTDRHLWAETYERDLGDILTLQGGLAQDIAERVRIKLTPEERSRVARPTTVTPSAYDAYLRGRFHLGERGPAQIAKAIQYFEGALREDPRYAPAYSGLADCYLVGWGSPLDYKKAEAHANKALELQPNLAEAHASLGFARLQQGDFPGAERELQRAVQLNPNYATAYHWYSGFFAATGRPDLALEQNDLARHLDPFSLPVNFVRGIYLMNLRRYDDAIRQLTTVVELYPRSEAPHWELGHIYKLKGMYGQAFAEEELAAARSGNLQAIRDAALVSKTYKDSGYKAALRKSVDLRRKAYEAAGLRPAKYPAYYIAFDYALLGDGAQVVRWLKRGYDDGDFRVLLSAAVSPELDPFRSNPGFVALLQRLELAR